MKFSGFFCSQKAVSTHTIRWKRKVRIKKLQAFWSFLLKCVKVNLRGSELTVLVKVFSGCCFWFWWDDGKLKAFPQPDNFQTNIFAPCPATHCLPSGTLCTDCNTKSDFYLLQRSHFPRGGVCVCDTDACERVVSRWLSQAFPFPAAVGSGRAPANIYANQLQLLVQDLKKAAEVKTAQAN